MARSNNQGGRAAAGAAAQRAHADDVAATQDELLPFLGIRTATLEDFTVRFVFDHDGHTHRAVMVYELRLLDELPAVLFEQAARHDRAERLLKACKDHAQHHYEAATRREAELAARNLPRRIAGHVAEWLRGTPKDLLRLEAERDEALGHVDLVDDHLARIRQDLGRVREWLDTVLQDADDYRDRREGLRRDPAPPPATVRVYPSVSAFIAEDPDVRDIKFPGIPGWEINGTTIGDDFTYEDPHTRLASSWRLARLRTGQVYAVRLWPNMEHSRSWHHPIEEDGPVWLLATLPVENRRDEQGVTAVDDEVVGRRRERNSLLYAADAYAALQHD